MRRRQFGLGRDEHTDHLTRTLVFHALARVGGAAQVFSNREEHKDIAVRLPAGFGLLDRGREFDLEAAPHEIVGTGYQGSRTVVNQEDGAAILDVLRRHGT